MQFNSLSSSLMTSLTFYHNEQGCLNKLISVPGYGLIAIVAAVETVAASFFTLIALTVYPISDKPLMFCRDWLNSSSFTIIWAIVDMVISPITSVVVADETSARKIAHSGNICMIPKGSIIYSSDLKKLQQ